MKCPFLPIITIVFSYTVLLSVVCGCAETKGWKGGNACDQIRKNQIEIQKLDNQLRLLHESNRSEPSPDLVAQIESLQEQRRDLEVSSEKLSEDCNPKPVKKPLDKDIYPK